MRELREIEIDREGKRVIERFSLAVMDQEKQGEKSSLVLL
jgi:hypothetical protein